MPKKEKLVVVGGVAAGMSAASKARRMKPKMEITVFEKSGHVSYGACGLPYYVSDIIKEDNKLVVYTPKFFKEKRNIDVNVNHEVVKVDPSSKTVDVIDLVSGRDFTVGFDKLMLGTGGIPAKIKCESDFKNVFYLNNVEDGIALKKMCRKAKKMAIIGGGYIALEMSEALARWGIETIVVHRSEQVLRSFDPDMSIYAEKELENNGVRLYKEQGLIGFEGKDNVKKVVTEKGEYGVDAVLVAIGVKPNVKLAKDAGIEIGRTGGIKTDNRMETSIPDIYSGGDNTESYDMITEMPSYVPLGTTANKMGKVAGTNIGGGNDTFPGIMGSAITKIFELCCARTGINTAHAQRLGIDVITSLSRQRSRAHYYPGSNEIVTKLIMEKESGRIIGAQMIGHDGVPGRIDIFGTAMLNKMTPQDLYKLDVCYSPPYAPVWDPILIAADQATKALRKG
ncbi:MAG: FAD-dependent oxidoreductase [Candidatus Methanofastidiosia archaeon]